MRTTTIFASRPSRLVALLILVAALGSACGDGTPPRDPWLEGTTLLAVDPSLVLPGTELIIAGRHFVDNSLGETTLALKGVFAGEEVDLRFRSSEFVDFDHFKVLADATFLSEWPAAEGRFEGVAWIEVVSVGAEHLYVTTNLPVTFDLKSSIQPRLDDAQDGILLYVNDRVEIVGEGFFLTESEGTTFARLEGCFQPTTETECQGIAPQEIALITDQPFERSFGSYLFLPDIAGIHSGVFEGSVTLVNRHADGLELFSDVLPITYELLPAVLYSVSPSSVSLGQYVELRGGGFVGGSSGGGTELFVEGIFTPTGSDVGASVDLLLLPDFLEGRRVRYIMNEDDELGRLIDLRQITGSFVGQIRVRVSFEGEEELGPALDFNFDIAPVKQVVHLRFLDDYVNSLRHFGLRAVDSLVRERVAQVVARDYATINLDVRIEEPTDFALYSIVDISGEDTNGLGLLGYDNTDGKDVDNLRLYDHIGGVNAVTQQDGYPGFGGVFIESLFAFSTHPKGRASEIPASDPTFDEIFDGFRPDVETGVPVRAADFAGPALVAPVLDPGCPAVDRQEQILCAIWVLGNMVGTTVSHEIGHSLGLANPGQAQSFHNDADEENRLMDNGGDRPFLERAQLRGEGPGRFCRGSYDYLRDILPTTEAANYEGRESCF